MNRAEIAASLSERARSGYPEARTVDADEVAAWPAGTLDELLRQGLLVPAQPARSIICDGCDEDHVAEVEFAQWPHGSPLRLYIACPYVGHVPVDPERLRQWEIVDAGPLVDGDRSPANVTTAPEADLVPADPVPEEFWASEDYRSVTLGGRTYPLTEAPALVVRMLDEAFERRIPDVTWERIQMVLLEAGFQAPRMVDVFRRVDDWRDLVIQRKRGSYRLNRRSL